MIVLLLPGSWYKPGVQIFDGSAGMLVENLLIAQGKSFSCGGGYHGPDPAAYNVILTAEPSFAEIRWPEGSTVLDPFGIIADDQEGVTVIRVGRA